MPDPLLTLSQWLLLALTALAPWALACQPPWAGRALAAGLTLAVACRGGAAVRRRRRRAGYSLDGWPLWALIAGLLAVGWAAVLRVDAVAADTRTPASSIAATVRLEMESITPLLLGLVLAADLGRDARWRGRAGRVVAGTAALVAGVGAAEHLGLVRVYGPRMSVNEGYPFGPFNYHANAGAFLNLALPLAVLACGRRPGALLATAAILLGTVVNVSRAAQVVTGVELLACAAVCAATATRRPHAGAAAPVRRPALRYAGGALVALAVAAVLAVGAGQSARRWTSVSTALDPNGSRPTLWRVCLGMARSAGVWGDGPGTFKLLFPHSPHMLFGLYAKYIVQPYRPGERVSMWNHAHNDYLQSVIEWGWPGTLLWAALFAGGGLTASRAAWRGLRSGHAADGRLAAAVAIAIGGVLLHALVDFPLQVEALRLDVAVLLGLAWSARHWANPTPDEAAGPVPSEPTKALGRKT